VTSEKEEHRVINLGFPPPSPAHHIKQNVNFLNYYSKIIRKKSIVNESNFILFQFKGKANGTLTLSRTGSAKVLPSNGVDRNMNV
jgi:hypothetical protein